MWFVKECVSKKKNCVVGFLWFFVFVCGYLTRKLVLRNLTPKQRQEHILILVCMLHEAKMVDDVEALGDVSHESISLCLAWS